MKVAFVPRYGGPEVVELREVPTPAPGPGQVRLRVLATSVSAGDWRVRSGNLPRGFGLLRGPALGFGGPRKGVLGTDAAGVIDAVGPGVTRFAVGDAVLAFPGITMGAHAEHLVLPEHGPLVRLPAGLTPAEAAALPFGAMTALDFLRRGEVKAGEHVLVNGASGAVGVAFVQLAKHLGARVTAVCSAGNAALVRSLGADDVVDYTSSDFAAGEPRFDVVIDTAGTAPYGRVRPVLRPGGRLLAVLADLPATLGAPLAGRRHGHRVVAGPAAEKVEDLQTLADLAAAGVLRPVIDRVLPFDDVVEAHRVVEGGHKRGAVVLVHPEAAVGG